MSEPRTQAGRTLLALLGEADVRWPDDHTILTSGVFESTIAAIEAEAAAQERERIREAVRALPEPTLGLKGGVSRASVLALLEGDDE